LARILAPLILVAITVGVGLKISSTKLLAPLWTELSTPQIRLYLILVALLCLACYLWARFTRIAFGPFLIAVAAVLTIVAAGLAASAAVGVILIGSFILGAAAWTWTSRDHLPPAALLVAVGLAVNGIVLSIAARFPINNRFFFLALALAPLALLCAPKARVLCKGWVEDLARSARKPAVLSEQTIALDLGVCCLVAVLGIHLLYVLLPERYYDALVVHLYIPSFILAHGSWNFDVNTWAFGHMPLTIDFLYTILFALGGEEATRLFNFAVLVLIASSLFKVLERFTNASAAIWTTVLFVTTPLALIETASLFIENTLALWIFAGAAILMLTWQRVKIGETVIVLILLCAAVMSKLHGGVAASLIGSSLIVGFARTVPTARSWALFTAAVFAAICIAGLPYLHAWLDTGNPVFPFANNIFKSPLWPPVAFEDQRWVGRFHWAMLWDATFRSSSYIEGYDGVLGLGLLLFLPLGIFASCVRGKLPDILALLIGIGYVVIIATQLQYLRYFYIVFPILFLMIGTGVAVTSQSQAGKLLVSAVLVVAVAFNAYRMPAAGWVLVHTDFRAAFDPEVRRQLEIGQVPERVANRFINERAGSQARVLYTGNPFGALLQGTALLSNWYSTRYAKRIASIKAPDEIGPLVKAIGATYAVHNIKETTPYQQAAGQYLRENARELARFGSLIVYELPA
jgi:hypothetical protein